MKKMLLPLVVLATVPFVSFSQSKAYAITSEIKGDFNWTAIREIDFSTGEFSKTLFSKQNQAQLRTTNGNAVTTPLISGRGVAAAAFDKVNNRLYFSEMQGNELKYIDLNNNTTNTLSVNVNTNSRYSTGAKLMDESNIITRMAFTNDGTGYALSNDGNNLIKFTTNEAATITNLGALRDSRSNNNISIHNQCTSWGGDIVGDVYGNLYLFTMRNNIFKINIAKMEAEFIGSIKNLPATFTVNGAAADENGSLLIGSTNNTDGYYKVNMATLEASFIKAGNEAYNISDLANGNLLFQTKKAAISIADVLVNNTEISTFPNPTTNSTFNVKFGKVVAGNYTIQVSDISGKTVATKVVYCNGMGNEKMNLSSKVGTGVFMVRVINNEGKSIYNNKLVVE
jgi:Secretion system C-terminal sorting domain